MYPREVVNEALRLHAQGWTDRRVAESVGVSIWTVRHWRTGRRRGPRQESYREDRTTYCPLCAGAPLDENAYAYLLGLYLGDGHIVRARKGTYLLAIYCSAIYTDLVEECRSSVRAVFPVKPFTREKPGCTVVQAVSKHWPCIFPQHGPGPKHSRLIKLDAWQQEVVRAHPQQLIRGLFHSDGCRATNRVRRMVSGEWKYYEYPRYSFSNTSKDIHTILGDTLDQVGAKWKLVWVPTKAAHHQDTGTLSVAKRDSVALLDTFIGPKS
ncbi:helix-turn-helix domain-containing protein [Nocardiopsis suaedae]|uniref:Helix-turn-helix domain containing protein n=1 Tax=Nocardiopsis suaedae TaxID=3018444 RepID=A0ABT4TLJ3_9ACTN|nr:helix-turn-helix domain-containing protein [Nocardiopsis suaedae]MDA2805570.1 helix-turn-helix domain containing protein [Nocardiopsis suaedae]